MKWKSIDLLIKEEHKWIMKYLLNATVPVTPVERIQVWGGDLKCQEIVYVLSHLLHHEQDVKQGQFLSRVEPVALLKLKNPVYPAI